MARTSTYSQEVRERAVRMVFGDLGVVQRCQLHKQRNVPGHLPDGMQASVKSILHEAWSPSDAKLARARLERLASSLEADHPGAAAQRRSTADGATAYS